MIATEQTLENLTRRTGVHGRLILSPKLLTEAMERQNAALIAPAPITS
jgi:hypothetical protein